MFRVLRTALSGFRAHRGFFMASGLSFNFLTCLIPVLFFIVALAGFVLTRKAAADVVLNQLSELVPVYKKELHQALDQIVRRRNVSGILGTVILLFFASQMFASMRLVLNDIFGFSRGRGFFRDLLKDVVMVFVFGILFLASVAITDLFGWLRIFLLQPARMPPEWIRSLFIALALGFNIALFFVAYRYFPHRKIPAGPALAGALLSAVLWEVAKQLFRWYILSVGVYDKIYGPLGALVGLGMFAYYSGVVFLLGAEFAAALVGGRRAR
ncbi:MAG TPA: YihY/virulence factor BrkB family protein [Methylomirabilota bacterium]|nr:YihY/virulence factor BrkB family protein [Methylomirabilota bacterium]